MITIHDRKTTYKEALISNGLYDLSKMIISAEVTEDIYGNYELKIEAELQGGAPTNIYEMLEVDSIIKVNDEGSKELFRIAQTEKGLDIITVYCRHITISDSLNLWLSNVRPTNLNGMAALQWISARTEPKCNLLLSSNIAKVSTADYVRKNLYEAMFDGDNAFIKRWGGEVKRTGYTIRIDSKIGQDKSDVIKIKEALNLVSFESKSNIDEVSTVIYPVGFDGITAPRVESPLMNNYSMEFPIEIKYEDVKVKKQPEEGQEPTEQDNEGYDTLEEAQAELTRRAEKEFSEKHLDKIKFECDIDYIDLEKYEEYKDLTALQTAFLGDIISVRVDTFDMDIKARVVARKYDVLRNKRIENTISTDGTLKKPESIKDIIKDVISDNEFPEIWEGLGDYVDGMIQQGFKNGYVVYEKNAVYAVDRLPKEKALNVVVMNKHGIGYSSTGISGPYKYGFTIDGKLNADMITTGSMSGQYIKAGSIEADRLSVQAKAEITEGMATDANITQINVDIKGLKGEVAQTKTDLNGVNEKITAIDVKADGITNMVREEYRTKADSDALYSTQSQLEQTASDFTYKFTQTGAENLILNSHFDGGFDNWTAHQNPKLSTETGHLNKRYGKMISIETGGGGIYQRFDTIPGEVYTVSFYAEADERRPLATTIGIEHIHHITLLHEPGFKRWDFKFTATNTSHTFIAYLGQTGKLYLGRVMVSQGDMLQEYRRNSSEIYSNITKIDKNGLEITSNNANTKTRIDNNGMKVIRKDDNSNLLVADSGGVTATGGAFHVSHENGNMTLWGRDIEINGHRAMVGTGKNPEHPLDEDKLYINYTNDFANGVEIGGKVTNNKQDIITDFNSQITENGFTFLSNGFKMQWGRKTVHIQGGRVIEDTINFPTPFPNSCIIFIANLESVDGNNFWTANYNITSRRFNRFSGGVYGLNLEKYIVSQGALADISWIAIGV